MSFQSPSPLLIIGGATAAAVLIGAAWDYVKRRNSHGTCNAHRGPGQRAIWFFDSHLGSIEVQVFGPSAGPLVLALHGLNPAGPIRYEWDNTAYQLCQQGYRVIIPQLHSNPRTAPALVGGISADDAARLIRDILTHHQESSCILMGKSWGGRTALEFASTHPDKVKKLILVCPAVSSKHQAQLASLKRCPVAVCWAEDDRITPIANLKIFLQADLAKLTVRIHASGGHMILPIYIDQIVQFVQDEGAE